ncbi:uncharacterized protein BBOV_IV008350 [Babesia bovis T2Bo]|uniref:Uncharacterized protein n=1 Tax=Babesia bovis TaxID=5865 RepID=A7ARM0_BABBO|nr:uncharacterized protein BBOV_IV008350 [Babesia bovis T2Bo]EDO07189.1 hypothetical protein BBOV_IV008350 [Babesia bovis T2Bo]|eukprot:XP_001610757.1 hypothetical protein [Babesia bovis T2Bo]
MAERVHFFRCMSGLCTRRKCVSQVTEPSVVSTSSEIPFEKKLESRTLPLNETLVLPLEVAPAVDAVSIPPCSHRSASLDAPVHKDVSPLVTDDVYDPLIMSFSPRVSRRSMDSAPVKPKAVDNIHKDSNTITPKVGGSTDGSGLWYSDPVFNNVSKKDGTDAHLSLGGHLTALDESQSTDVPANRSEANGEHCESSLRYYELMSHYITDDWSSLNSRVYDALLQYFMGSDPQANRNVSKEWADNVRLLMNRKTAKIVNAFKSAYDGQLAFESSYMICQSVFTAQKSMRIDLVLRAKLLPVCANFRNTLQYTFNYTARNVVPGQPIYQPTYANKFVFDCLKRYSRRTVSFTRDVSSIHGDDLHVAAPESVSQVCEGDSIEVPIVLMNALGNADIESISFQPLRVQPVVGDPQSSLDRMHREWFTVGPNSQYLQQLFPSDIDEYILVEPDMLQPELSHQLTQVAGIDVITSRSFYVAAKPGKIVKAQNFIGHTMEVIDASCPIVCMLQRAGMQYDRLCHVQLRVGDNVRFYTTKG